MLIQNGVNMFTTSAIEKSMFTSKETVSVGKAWLLPLSAAKQDFIHFY